MSELGTRKGERTKKVPKHLQYDDADYGNFLTVRTTDQKEKPSNAAEISQIARLLQKYVTSINQKLRDYHQGEVTERYSNENNKPNEVEPKRTGHQQNGETNGQKPSGISSVAGKRARDIGDRAGGQPKPSKNDPKKQPPGPKVQPTTASNVQPDPYFHGLLSNHIRSAYPNVANLSPEILKGMDIPKQLLEPQNGHCKSQKKQEKGKGQQMLRGMKSGKQGKDELKPFKRQSYHVAIAYHIHLKLIKTINPSATDIDPTYPARKLRESQSQHPPKQ